MQPTAQAVGEADKKIQPRRGERRMSHTCGNILLHFIFSTHERRPLIKSEFRDDLFAYLGGIIREMNGSALIVNGTADHVHLLVRMRPAHAPAEIARVIKANSSRWIRERRREFAWQTGYGVFSVSESNVDAVRKYIADQEAHHKKRSFQDEFRAFLKEERDRRGREVRLGLVSFAPAGPGSYLRPNPRLAPWASVQKNPAPEGRKKRYPQRKSRRRRSQGALRNDMRD